MAILNLSRDVRFNSYIEKEIASLQAGDSGLVRSFVEYTEGLKELEARPDLYSVVAIDIESADDLYGLDALDCAWKITSVPIFKIRPKFLIHSRMSLTYDTEKKLRKMYQQQPEFATRLSYLLCVKWLLRLSEQFHYEFRHLHAQCLHLLHRHWVDRDICREGESLVQLTFDLHNPAAFVPLSLNERLIVQELVMVQKPVNQSNLRQLLNADKFFKQHSHNAPIEEANETHPIARTTFNAELITAEAKLRVVYEELNGRGSFSRIWKKLTLGNQVRIVFDVVPHIEHVD